METAQRFSGMSPLNAQLLEGAAFRKADITFETDHVLDLGGVRVRLKAVGPAHTRGDTVFFVEPDRVLFSGDVVMTALPAFSSPASSVARWQSNLDALEALKPVRIVPSHGPMGDITMLRAWREYFETLQARARELKAQGRTADQVAETLEAELAAKYPKWNKAQANRVGPAARAAFSEVR